MSPKNKKTTRSYRQRLNDDLQIAITLNDDDMQNMIKEKLQSLKDYHKEYKRNARKSSIHDSNTERTDS